MQQSSQHSAAGIIPVGACDVTRLSRCAALAACLVSSLAAAGCSVSFPLGSMVAQSDEITGSIKPRPGQTSDEEDRRRAKAALATALDLQGAGTEVTWDNPASGNKGAFRPSGPAYPADGRICRPFTGTSVQNGSADAFEGKACTSAGSADWLVSDRKPLAKI